MTTPSCCAGFGTFSRRRFVTTSRTARRRWDLAFGAQPLSRPWRSSQPDVILLGHAPAALDGRRFEVVKNNTGETAGCRWSCWTTSDVGTGRGDRHAASPGRAGQVSYETGGQTDTIAEMARHRIGYPAGETAGPPRNKTTPSEKAASAGETHTDHQRRGRSWEK